MSSPATLRDVARRAGVHVATASRALNPSSSSSVSEATARKVRAAAEALNYRPNAIARSLKTNRSMSVGILLPDLTNPHFPPITRGIEDVLGAAGYTSLIANTDNDSDREARQLATMRARQVDGFIIMTALRSDPLLRSVAESRVPVVLVNRRADGPALPSVTGDDRNGIHAAVRHLAALGHTRIAHLAGPQTTSTGHARLRAYRETLDELGLDSDLGLIVHTEAFTEAEGARALRALLDSGQHFTAVVAGNDLIALGCYDVCEERRLRCPDDVSLVGFNDMPFIDKLKPPLTTVRIPHYEIGAEGARMLLERLADPTLPAKSITLPVSLVERGSTGPPPLGRGS